MAVSVGRSLSMTSRTSQDPILHTAGAPAGMTAAGILRPSAAGRRHGGRRCLGSAGVLAGLVAPARSAILKCGFAVWFRGRRGRQRSGPLPGCGNRPTERRIAPPECRKGPPECRGLAKECGKLAKDCGILAPEFQKLAPENRSLAPEFGKLAPVFPPLSRRKRSIMRFYGPKRRFSSKTRTHQNEN